MAGSDNIRGVTFQHLCAVLKALELLESPDDVAIRIEGKDDIVDYEILNSEHKRVYVAQAKSRAEPDTWKSSDLVTIIQKWSEIQDDTIERYEFFTDGQLGRRNTIPSLLESLRTQQLPENNVITELQQWGISAPSFRLRRMYVRTRFGEVPDLFDRAVIMSLQLLEHIEHQANSGSAENLVTKLYSKLSFVGGDQSEAKRLVSRLLASIVIL